MTDYLAKDYLKVPGLPLGVRHIMHGREIPMHNHEFIEIAMISQGTGVNVQRNASGEYSFGLMPGDVFAVGQEEQHAYLTPRNLLAYNVMFQPGLIREIEADLQSLNSWNALFSNGAGRAEKIHLSVTERQAAELCLGKMILAFSLQTPGFRITARSAAMEFFTIIGHGKIMAQQDTDTPADEGLLKSIAMLENSPEKSFQLETLATHAGMSISSYTRKFRAFTGVSPIDYLLHIRLDQARKLLAETRMPVADIAETVGFCDSNYLIKLFRQNYNLTPGKYRNLLKPRLR